MPIRTLPSRSERQIAFDAEAREFARIFSRNVECGAAFAGGEIARLSGLAELMARDVEAWRVESDQLHARRSRLGAHDALRTIMECVFDEHLTPEALRLLAAGVALALA
jgi:hypothetical protein